MKSCSRCKEVKSLSDFTKNKSSKDGLSNWCKSCKKLSDKRYIHLPGGGRSPEAEEITAKLFESNPRKIKEEKPGAKKRGRQPSKVLSPEELKEYFKVNDKRRNYLKRLRRYGLTEEQHIEQLRMQDYTCAICDCAIDKSDPIDHCHESLLVRGILCRDCNLGLGFFKDNQQALINAIKYLGWPKNIKYGKETEDLYFILK